MNTGSLKTNPAVLTAFDRMIAGVEGVERRGATMPYVAVNGNMYAMINKADTIGLMLSDKDFATFISTYNAKPFESIPGLQTKNFVAIPPTMYVDLRTMQMWFKLGYAYAARLPAKPTR